MGSIEQLPDVDGQPLFRVNGNLCFAERAQASDDICGECCFIHSRGYRDCGLFDSCSAYLTGREYFVLAAHPALVSLGVVQQRQPHLPDELL